MHSAISHASRRPLDVILRRSFTRPSIALAVIEGLGTRLLICINYKKVHSPTGPAFVSLSPLISSNNYHHHSNQWIKVLWYVAVSYKGSVASSNKGRIQIHKPTIWAWLGVTWPCWHNRCNGDRCNALGFQYYASIQYVVLGWTFWYPVLISIWRKHKESSKLWNNWRTYPSYWAFLGSSFWWHLVRTRRESNTGARESLGMR